MRKQNRKHLNTEYISQTVVNVLSWMLFFAAIVLVGVFAGTKNTAFYIVAVLCFVMFIIFRGFCWSFRD